MMKRSLLFLFCVISINADAQYRNKYLRLYNEDAGIFKSTPKGMVSYYESFRNLFLCECIFNGYKKDTVLYRDNSRNLYIELLLSVPPALEVIDSMSSNVASKISGEGRHKDENAGRAPILGICIEEYEKLTRRRIRKISRAMTGY